VVGGCCNTRGGCALPLPLGSARLHFTPVPQCKLPPPAMPWHCGFFPPKAKFGNFLDYLHLSLFLDSRFLKGFEPKGFLTPDLLGLSDVPDKWETEQRASSILRLKLCRHKSTQPEVRFTNSVPDFFSNSRVSSRLPFSRLVRNVSDEETPLFPIIPTLYVSRELSRVIGETLFWRVFFSVIP